MIAHQPNQTLNQNSIYYTPPPTSLTQLTSQVQSINQNLRNSTAIDSSIYTNQSAKATPVDSKSDENNNLESTNLDASVSQLNSDNT